jgi:hypothetical protein
VETLDRKSGAEGSNYIRINEENIAFFKPGKGLRQGDPLSPFFSI